MCQGGRAPQLTPRPPDPLLELLTDPGRPTARLMQEGEGKCRLDIIILSILIYLPSGSIFETWSGEYAWSHLDQMVLHS